MDLLSLYLDVFLFCFAAKKKKEKKVAQVVVEPPVDEILEQMQDLGNFSLCS